MIRPFFALCTILISVAAVSQPQPGYWQQQADYVMQIEFDDIKHQFFGTQSIKYTNNSPDTLTRLFYHLYFNAFQPGSHMDLRSRTIDDPDDRIGARLVGLKPEEQGYHKIEWLTLNGKKLKYKVEGTILSVELEKPILPNTTHELEMSFQSQVPVQIRRSGRNNSEGVAYTMTQWYPKLCEYDTDGWHSNPYISREFHGVWGSFDVSITMPSEYTLAGTGYVQNPDEVGHGYESANSKPVVGSKTTWHFKAPNVHDFAWAADKNYRHIKAKGPNDMTLHFFHKQDSTINDKWDKLVPYAVRLFEIMNDKFGEYPYKQFSTIQAGDGGMEYPMCTMISSDGSFGALVSVTVHEAIHNWYYGVLATNESKYPWMDEGFTTFAQGIVLDSLFTKREDNPHARRYRGYLYIATSGKEEPITTHADHYETNQGYGIAAYSKGSVFLAQLEYVVGEEALFKSLKRYFNLWQFKHPRPEDFKRIVEKVSGLELDWYFENWIGTTKTIDYALRNISDMGKGTKITVERIGSFPMPVDIQITTKKGEQRIVNIPLEIMRGSKPNTLSKKIEWRVLEPWPWTYPFYEFEVAIPLEDIANIEIDPRGRMADIDRSNNIFPIDATLIRTAD